MGDGSYDAIVVDGGHHGTIIACQLHKAGFQAAVFQAGTKLGGAVTAIL